MKITAIILLLLLPLVTRADNPRHNEVFTSPNGKYELRRVNDRIEAFSKWSLVEKVTNKEIYQLEGPYLYQMTLVVGDDGDSVVAIDDWSELEASKDLNVLFFYIRGKLIKKYTLGELNGMDAVSYSVSHFRWLIGGASDFIIQDSKIEFTTFRLDRYKFDVNTGQILNKERDRRLDEASIYAYGEIVQDLANGRYVMEVCTLVQGKIPESGKLEFESKAKKFSEGWYATVIVKDGKLVADANVPGGGLPFMNSCTYKENQRKASQSENKN